MNGATAQEMAGENFGANSTNSPGFSGGCVAVTPPNT